jgi:TolB protein
MTRRCLPLAVALLAAVALPALAQDPVRVGIDYRPGMRPRVVILPAPSGLDSARAILARDLDYSDRFEVVALPAASDPAPPLAPGQPPTGVNYELYRSLNAAWAVELVRASGGMALTLRLHDLATDQVRQDTTLAADVSGAGEGRMELHRLSDVVVGWITGQPGIAATRVLYQERGTQRIHRVDSDGHGVVPMSPGGATALSPTWAPDGARFAYVVLGNDGQSPVIIQDLSGGARRTVPTTGEDGNHNTPAFSPDGRSLAFARLTAQGAALFRADLARGTVERLTPPRYPANLSPTWSPDSRRIAFVSDRAGAPQIYVMSADGTDQELLVPYDFGATGASYAPEWSSDGTMIVFHRDVSGSPQLFVYVLASRQVRQLTSQGRNEDPSWAPDGRHIVYISDRTGRRQLHVIDLETARVRQIPTPGIARLPSWSSRLGGPQ